MILVVGATGVLGSEICRRLRARNLPVRGLVRPGSAREAELRAIGVEICNGDLRSAADIDKACRGAEAVISTATVMGSKDKSLTLRAIDRDAQLRLVETAKRSGVKTFVYISAAPHLLQTAPLIRYKRQVEAAVRASGMRWTVLQPSVFMEIWLSKQLGWDFDAGLATIVGRGTAPLTWISVDDVAEHAVRSLDDQRLANRDVPLGGPQSLAPNDVVQILERRSGRPFRRKRIPAALLRLMSPVVAQFNEAAASGMSLFAQTADGEQLDMSIQRDIGLPLTSVEEYADRTFRVRGA